ncbi:MAG: ribonuclease HII [Firmicutes bacterium]|nr:ribonuclease HII [Bacillota bacterium]
MKKEERIEKMKERLIEMQVFENELRAGGAVYIAGVDEVGRGPLAGPVVSACVVLPADFDVLGVDDSKKLSEKKREELYDIIMEKAVAIGIGMRDNERIDEINILEATKEAMIDAVSECDKVLAEKSEQLARIEHVLFDAMVIQKLPKSQTSIIKGDSKSVSIAAASIIAKVTRDRMMCDFAEKYPYYAFESNKGYGTKAHYEGIAAAGICPIHRKTFLKNIIE